MASVRKQVTSSGTVFWKAVWSIKVDGKRRQMSRSFAKKTEARAFASRMGDEAEGRGIGDQNKFSTRAFFEYWLANHPKALSPTTRRGYKRNLALLSRHVGDIPFAKLTTRDLDGAYPALLKSGGKARGGKGGTRPLTARTVLHIHRAVHNACRQAVKWSLIAVNPAANATPPQPKRSKARALTDPEWQAIWKAAQKARYPGMAALVATAAASGMRRSELAGLCWDCVDLDAGKLYVRRALVINEDGSLLLREVTKTEDSERGISLPASVVELLKAHKMFLSAAALAYGREYQRTPFMCFPEGGGLACHPDTMTARFRSLMNTAGIKGAQPAHAFRHSMATNALVAGVDVKTVSSRLGHSRVSTTLDIYVHSDDERDRAAAAVLGSVLKL